MSSPIEPSRGAPAWIHMRTASRCSGDRAGAPLGIGLPATSTSPGSVAARSLLYRKLLSGTPGSTRNRALLLDFTWIRLS